MANNYRNPRGHTDPIRSRDGRAPTERDVYRSAVSRPRKNKRGPRISAAVVLTAVLLISVTAACIGVILKGDRPQETRQSELAGALVGTLGDDNVSAPNGEMLEYISKKGEDVHRGDLILINYENEYVFPESEDHLVNIYTHKSPYCKVAYSYYLLDNDVLNRFNGLIEDMYSRTGETNIHINSSYRDYESQKQIYEDYTVSYGEEYAEKYVATPGYSEHHSGYAVDLGIFYDDGTGVPLESYENLGILKELFTEHGFIQRYTENKYEITKTNPEPWHYRYVGYPHSEIMVELDLCLEEYIEYLKPYTADGSALVFTPTGELTEAAIEELPSDGYVIYYVPEDSDGVTDVPIPSGETEYRISGNNRDGFIVSVNMDGDR